jgi:ketosteroid isomerase-like protein
MSELTEAQRRNLEAVSTGVDAFRRGDAEGVLDFMCPDVEIFLPVEFPNSGTYRGHDGYLAWQADWLEAWDDFSIEIAGIQPVGERHVVALIRQTGKGRGSGIPVDMRIAYMWEVRGRQAAAFHLYPTEKQAVSVAEQRESQPAN